MPTAGAEKVSSVLAFSAGFFVLSAPAPTGLESEEGEAFLSIDIGDPDAGSVIEHLGWRHRATTAHLGSAKRIGGQG
jgi:hypothetical protein